MSLTPVTPNLQNFAGKKDFWFKKDSIAGWGILGVLGALLIYGWGTIVPFLVNMMQDTVHLMLLVAAAAAIIMVATSDRTRLVFRLVSRYLTNLIITIDPIGILKDKLLQMKKRRETMETQITNVSGQVKFLKTTIDKNHQSAVQQFEQADFAQRKAKSTQDANEALRMSLQVRVKANKAGRLENANVSYQQLLTKLTAIYDMLVKWSANVDAYIEDTEDTVRQEEIKYKTINAAYKAYRTALNVIKGNASEDDLYNSTMEYLAEEAGRKLGEMEDFQRVAQGFMDNLDIQNGAITEDALKQLDAYEQKLMTSGNQDTAFLLPGASATPVPVPAKTNRSTAATTTGSGSDYNDIFK